MFCVHIVFVWVSFSLLYVIDYQCDNMSFKINFILTILKWIASGQIRKVSHSTHHRQNKKFNNIFGIHKTKNCACFTTHSIILGNDENYGLLMCLDMIQQNQFLSLIHAVYSNSDLMW